MAQSIFTGQQVAVLLEDFDPNYYVQNKLNDQVSTTIEDSAYKAALQVEIEAIVERIGENDTISPEAIIEARNILVRAKNPESLKIITFAELKNNPVLRQTSLFSQTDLINRGRAIAREQFALLKKSLEEKFPEASPFILETNIDDYVAKLTIIRQAKASQTQT